MDKFDLIVKNTRIDIQNNYDDCINGFMEGEYRTVMD